MLPSAARLPYHRIEFPNPALLEGMKPTRTSQVNHPQAASANLRRSFCVRIVAECSTARISPVRAKCYCYPGIPIRSTGNGRYYISLTFGKTHPEACGTEEFELGRSKGNFASPDRIHPTSRTQWFLPSYASVCIALNNLQATWKPAEHSIVLTSIHASLLRQTEALTRAVTAYSLIPSRLMPARAGESRGFFCRGNTKDNYRIPGNLLLSNAVLRFLWGSEWRRIRGYHSINSQPLSLELLPSSFCFANANELFLNDKKSLGFSIPTDTATHHNT
ncbi:hypothetical protein R3P38DRAFT_2801115 [Favolaschia claudopus]|uniref:Uncharacterized protein n=1 Tax=Favolaschia claudopus TaxID=2862362 RepID=A0AAV9ZVT4_9AGAR